MKVTLQVERHVVAVETDYRPSDSKGLFDVLMAEVVKKMEWVLDNERPEKKAQEGGEK